MIFCMQMYDVLLKKKNKFAQFKTIAQTFSVFLNLAAILGLFW